ncbi:ammonia-forming cytochrome c nitrite reductase [Stygiobacter electus]|uniref:nitrite reductase (cytochrome; ammonia-forming) n=1 Tax=Stygiobacter electus TaxID=3032292 RepID=A0AAE3P2E1_9BACT|nr:ammonia-forming cytochrome c nitrite reductase [Stygiobacter electus]MDF1611590.1 ammonia-forming cytochrome c nitrite reductase [Stygiobacter electus]
MRPIQELIKEKPWLSWVLFFSTVIIVFLLGLFASSIVERRNESFTLQMVKPINDWEPRNEVWGENYPREYESYLKMADTTFASKYAGSATRDYLQSSPELIIMWAGYAFSKDYKAPRGHSYSIVDIRNTLRTGGNKVSPQPATCWSCKSPDVPRMMNKMGVENFYKAKWKDLGHEIVNPIGCQDCHDPKTMNLRITRPALMEAFKRQGKDIKDATHNEMRSLVCAQCHVEYYFKGDGKYLTFPWDKGMTVEKMEEYYDESNFKDWEHALSKAPMLKAQHPDFELYSMGVHADRGVSCADCHMPYKTEGGVKFTDHHIQSPLNNIENSCMVCHREKKEKLIQNVYERQDKVKELLREAEKTLAATHLEAKIAWDNKATEEEMKPALKLIRQAQWRWDWVAAANGVGFHAPVEALRVLGNSIQKAEQARKEIALVLVKHNVKYPVALPDYSTKEKAQKLIGLKMDELIADKKEFLKTTALEWDKKAEQRQGFLKKY